MMFRPTLQCSLVKFLDERKMKFSVGCFVLTPRGPNGFVFTLIGQIFVKLILFLYSFFCDSLELPKNLLFFVCLLINLGKIKSCWFLFILFFVLPAL